jgi:hypothetical protein
MFGGSMRSKLHLLLSLLAIPLFGFALHTYATPITNIVTNGGFETGDFSGWTQGGNTDFTGVDSSSAHSGNFGAFAGPTSGGKGSSGGPGTLSQNLTTIVGQSYELSFWMYNDGSKGIVDGGSSNVMFQVFWNGTMIFDNSGTSTYQQFQFFNLAVTSTSTQLKFVFLNDPGFFHFDDVVAGITATGVPEAMSTLWLALPTLAMIGFLQLRRRIA